MMVWSDRSCDVSMCK